MAVNLPFSMSTIWLAAAVPVSGLTRWPTFRAVIWALSVAAERRTRQKWSFMIFMMIARGGYWEKGPGSRDFWLEGTKSEAMPPH